MSDNWQKWTETRNKSLSSVPLWLEKAVEEYQERFGFQSWSAAVLEILACYLNQEHDYIRFGDKEFEDALIDKLNEEESKWKDMSNPLEGLLRDLVAPPKHGGDRKSKPVLARCPYCGHEQEITSSDEECRKCGECEFITITD